MKNYKIFSLKAQLIFNSNSELKLPNNYTGCTKKGCKRFLLAPLTSLG